LKFSKWKPSKVPNVASPSGSCSAVSRMPTIGKSAMIENRPRIT
jgi:hypothetical protein